MWPRGHILSIGPLEAILELNRRLEPHKEKGNFLPFAQLMDLFDQYLVVVGCGHLPRRRPCARVASGLPVAAEVPDLNGKDLALIDRRSGLPTPWGKS